MPVHYNGFIEKLKHVAHFGQQAILYKKVVTERQPIYLSTNA